MNREALTHSRGFLRLQRVPLLYEGMPHLKHLCISHCCVQDTSGLKACPALEELHLHNVSFHSGSPQLFAGDLASTLSHIPCLHTLVLMQQMQGLQQPELRGLGKALGPRLRALRAVLPLHQARVFVHEIPALLSRTTTLRELELEALSMGMADLFELQPVLRTILGLGDGIALPALDPLQQQQQQQQLQLQQVAGSVAATSSGTAALSVASSSSPSSAAGVATRPSTSMPHPSLSTIQHFSLKGHTFVSDACLQCVAAAMPQLRCLSLDLLPVVADSYWNPWASMLIEGGPFGCISASGMQALQQNCPGLQALSFAYVPLSREAVHAVASMSRLRFISLAGNPHVDDGFIYRLSNPDLCHAVFSGCYGLSNLGLARLARSAPNLTALDLSGCDTQITDIGVAALGQLKHLRYLSLAFNSMVTDKGLEALLNAGHLPAEDPFGPDSPSGSSSPCCTSSSCSNISSACSSFSSCSLEGQSTAFQASNHSQMLYSRPDHFDSTGSTSQMGLPGNNEPLVPAMHGGVLGGAQDGARGVRLCAGGSSARGAGANAGSRTTSGGSACSPLTHLSLVCNYQITDAALQALARCAPHLRRLDLDSLPHLSEQGVARLALLPHLHTLSCAECSPGAQRVARALGVLAHGLRRGALSCIPPHTPGLRIPTAITNVLLSAHGGGVEESGRPRAVAQQQGPCSSCMQLLAFKSRRKLERAAQRDEGWKWDVDECAGFGQLLVPFMPSGFKDWDARSTIGGLGACLPAWWMQEC